mgnify:CR=1 FL=1
MTWPITVPDVPSRLNFHSERIGPADADRQLASVEEILRRLTDQPGLILADEVGMGKTFVALGVAMLTALADRGRNPVVVMVPSSLYDKWPRDFEVFRDLCLSREEDRSIRAESASSALEFFRLIDDPPHTRAQLIFLKHGAFHVQHIDSWIRLALIQRAMHGMHLGERRSALPRFAASLLRTKSSYKDPALFERLLRLPTNQWRDAINTYYAANPDDPHLRDDPVPTAVQKVFESDDLNLDTLRECLRNLPARSSASVESRLEELRGVLNEALKEVWPRALALTRFRSPLLILDEAHHLKNPATRLASLFVEPEAQEDAGVVAGALQGAFERMLFLTATPFQLGHQELMNVLGRFNGIAWKTVPGYSRETFGSDLKLLGEGLDKAQRVAIELDTAWQSLRRDDLRDQNGAELSPEEWWTWVISDIAVQPERVQVVLRAYRRALDAMKTSEQLLRRWVVRHLRDRKLPASDIERRTRLLGQSVRPGLEQHSDGLPIAGESLLPFLLAARAQAVLARGSAEGAKRRATFAEGLASSYEAFLETRQDPSEDSGKDEEITESPITGDRINWYLKKLETELRGGPGASVLHPKVAPLVERVVDLWSKGEKVVVFCHYRATGRALVRHISAGIEQRLWGDAAKRVGKSVAEVRREVMSFGDRFDLNEATPRPMQRHLQVEIDRRLSPYPALKENERSEIHDVVRRFIRTPVFVARYFDVDAESSAEVLQTALARTDFSGVSLGAKIDGFLRFIAERCNFQERSAYLKALNQIQPGARGERPLDDEGIPIGDAGELMPNVRLANGVIKQETRQRLMLCFNTPFFPEILVASSVLAEGVDLHLNCRYLIHHDLSWNPSTLEQRTGRVDRIGAKAEVVFKSIGVFLPYVAETQDEKQYRVVMDRERWFQVLMGEDYRTDEVSTNKIAKRVPFPLRTAEALAFNLSVGRAAKSL